MGIKCKNSSEYDLALVYYNRALKFAPNQKYVESVYNNIGTTYQSKNQHKKALEYFYKIKTDDNLRKNNVSFFAKIQGNLGYSKLNSGKIDESLAHLNEAIFIGDSINNPDIIATNKLRLATYYTIKKDTNNALKYINEALILAKSTKNYRAHLKGLKQLSSLDLTNSSKYLKEYIRIKDSISKTEQLLRDKFLRIANETDNIKKENHILQKKINTNTILAIVLILICLVLLFVTLSQKAKAAKLTHEKDQQKSNHEMYTLLLAQQHKLEEGKQLEKQRISEELHDSVLGKLFGTRINLESINSSNGQEIKSQRDFFIKEIKQIEEEIRNISHQLHKEIQTSPIDFVSLTQKSIAQKCLAAGITLKYLNDDHINWEVINGHTKINLYHILQETSKNCIKYTKSQYFYIEFNKKESYITLKIKYDGAELNDQSISTLAEFKNINSRIKKIKGTIAITSKLNKGTTIKINVPINEELNEKKT
jgi:signal transduction histidine kinase